MTLHVTHLINEEMPEPGTLRRVVSVHPGNRTYETAEVGHDPGWLVMDPSGTNPVYWTDDEVDEVHPSGSWVVKDGVPAPVLSRHGAKPEAETPRQRRQRRPRVTGEAAVTSEPTERTTWDEVKATRKADEEGSGES